MSTPARRSSSEEITAAVQSLRVIVAALTQSARSIEARTGITNAQLFVLRQLAGDSTLSVSDLAERAHTLQGTMSSVVSRLVRGKLLRKVRSSVDGRRALLSLTLKGQRLLARAPAPPTEAILEGLAALRRDDLHHLTHGLRALVDTLGLEADKAPLLFEERDGRR